LSALAAVGLIDLYFGDESGFWQNPVIARAWQFSGEEIRIFPEKGKRLAVFGLLNLNCEGRFWTSVETIKSEFVIECLEKWLQEKGEKPRVLVLDMLKFIGRALCRKSWWSGKKRDFTFSICRRIRRI